MNTPPNPLEYFKFQFSKNVSGSRFTHTVIDKLPQLGYRFAEGKNWNATDPRISNKSLEMDKWFKNYWSLRLTNDRRNDEIFEEELEQAILSAFENLKERWNKKIEKEFELEFEEPIVKFIKSKKQD